MQMITKQKEVTALSEPFAQPEAKYLTPKHIMFEKMGRVYFRMMIQTPPWQARVSYLRRVWRRLGREHSV